MAVAGDLVANLVINNRQFGPGLAQSRKELKSFVASARTTLLPLAGLFAGALGTRSSVSNARTQIDAERRLEATLKATGNAAGFSAQQLKDFAAARQGITNFGDEVTLQATTILTGFKRIQGEAFTDTIALAQDLTAATGIGLTDSMKRLGKALDDPIAGVSSLAKVGVKFTNQQLQQIRALQETGDLYGAQAIIIKELQNTIGGTAEATADPLTQMRNLIGDLGENIGFVMLPALRELNNGMQAGLGPITAHADSFKYLGEYIGVSVRVVIDWGKHIAAAGITVVTVTTGIKLATAATKLWTASLIALQSATPIGWVKLAAGAAVYAASVIGINVALEQTVSAGPAAGNALEPVSRQRSGLHATRTQLQGIHQTLQQITAQKQAVDNLFARFNPKSSLKKDLEDINQLLRSHHISADQAMFLERETFDQHTGVYSQIRDLKDEIAILNGETTATEVKLRNMLKVGAPPEAVAQVREYIEQLDQLKDSQKQREEERAEGNRIAEERRNAAQQQHQQQKSRADQLRESLMTPFEQLNRDLREYESLRKAGHLTVQEQRQLAANRKQEYGQANTQSEKTGPNNAAELGTGEAMSILARAMSGGGTVSVQERSARAQERIEEHNRKLAQQMEKRDQMLQELLARAAARANERVVRMS